MFRQWQKYRVEIGGHSARAVWDDVDEAYVRTVCGDIPQPEYASVYTFECEGDFGGDDGRRYPNNRRVKAFFDSNGILRKEYRVEWMFDLQLSEKKWPSVRLYDPEGRIILRTTQADVVYGERGYCVWRDRFKYDRPATPEYVWKISDMFRLETWDMNGPWQHIDIGGRWGEYQLFRTDPPCSVHEQEYLEDIRRDFEEGYSDDEDEDEEEADEDFDEEEDEEEDEDE